MRSRDNKGGREGAVPSWENINFYSTCSAEQRTEEKLGGKVPVEIMRLSRQEKSICEGGGGCERDYPSSPLLLQPEFYVKHRGETRRPRGLDAGADRSEALLRSALRCLSWLLLIRFRN